MKISWTDELDARLIDMCCQNRPVGEIATILGTTESAVWTRMSRIRARPQLDTMTQEAIAEKAADGWRPSRIARQYDIPEAYVATVVKAVAKGEHILANDRDRRVGRPRKPRPSWTTQQQKESVMPTKNRLSDLNDHLFAQLERLSDEDLTPEEVEKEATRADAIVAVADKIIQNAALGISAAKLVAGQGADPRPYLRTIEGQVAIAKAE